MRKMERTSTRISKNAAASPGNVGFPKKNFKHFQYESSDQHDNDLSAREDALTPLGGLFKNTDLGKVVL